MKNSKRYWNAASFPGLLICVALAGINSLSCSSDSPGEKKESVVKSDDGSATLTIPEGALPAGVSASSITISRSDSMITDFAGEARAWRLEPDGLVLSAPARLELGVSIAKGVIYFIDHQSGSALEFLDPVAEGSVRDAAGTLTTLAVDVAHFSSIAVLSVPKAEDANVGQLVVDWVTEPNDTFSGGTTGAAWQLSDVPTDIDIRYGSDDVYDRFARVTHIVAKGSDWSAAPMYGTRRLGGLTPEFKNSASVDYSGTSATIETPEFTCTRTEQGPIGIDVRDGRFRKPATSYTETYWGPGIEPEELFKPQSIKLHANISLTSDAICFAGREEKEEYKAAKIAAGDNQEKLGVPGSATVDLAAKGGAYAYEIELVKEQIIKVCATTSGSVPIEYFPRFPPGFIFLDVSPAGCTVITNKDPNLPNTVLMVLTGSSTVNVVTSVDSGSGDVCEGVNCTAPQWCNPSTGECDDPIPGQGECEQHPNSGTCGTSGKCIQGYCVIEVVMDGTTDGRAECAAQGLVCQDYPVFVPPEAACLAYNPDAAVTQSANGSRQAVYCDSTGGAACGDKLNTCHHCPACKIATGPTGCLQHGSDWIGRLYVTCVPAPTP